MPSDMDHMLRLFDRSQATAIAVNSGHSDDPATWLNGTLPTADGFFWVDPDVSLVQSHDFPRQRKGFVQGSLSPDVGFQGVLPVNTLGTDMGSMLAAGAVDARFTGSWQILFADYGAPDYVADPWDIGIGLLVGGQVRIYGADITAWGFTQGNAAGDTVIHMIQPVVGWKPGDQLVFSGTGYGTIDDSLATIQSISTDGMTVTLTQGLQFNHKQARIEIVNGTMELVEYTGLTARNPTPGTFAPPGYWDRPAVVMNRSAKRPVELVSENSVDNRQRGHFMLMNGNDAVIWNCAQRELGRTIKDGKNIVTDPDGLGGGLGNPRARYSGVHFHLNGASVTGLAGDCRNLFCEGGPGWGNDIHGSRAFFYDCAAYRVFAVHHATENGSETGAYVRCLAVRSTHPFTASEDLVSNHGVADFGHDGHGFWTQAGGVQLQNCAVTGSTGSAFVLQGLQFQLGTFYAMFDTANLPAGFTYNHPTCTANLVPQLHDGLTAFGCARGFAPWGIGANASFPAPIGRNSFKNIYEEFKYAGNLEGYNSCVDHVGTDLVGIDKTYSNNGGIFHSALNTSITRTHGRILNVDLGLTAPTYADNTISDYHVKALTGVHLMNPNEAASFRNIDADVTFYPLSTDDMADVVAKATPNNHQFMGIKRGDQIVQQVGEQCDWMLIPETPGAGVYDMQKVDNFAGACASDPYYAYKHDRYFRDGYTRTADGKYLFFPEQMPDFQLNHMYNVRKDQNGVVYGISAIPPQLQGLTNAQAQSQYKISVGGQVVPADAQPLPGSRAYYSMSPVMELPNLRIAQDLAFVHYTNQINYTVPVRDSSGKLKFSAPQVLTDKAWNIVVVNADGIDRGILVFCDTASSPQPPWFPMPSPNQVTLPNVVGMTFADASRAIGGLALYPSPLMSASPYTDIVASQSPPAGTMMNADDTVLLTFVDPAPAPTPNFAVPDVVGMTFAAAKSALNAKGFGDMPEPLSIFVLDTSVVVTAQYPSAGTLVPNATRGKVTLTLANPPIPKQVSVPNVVGKTFTNAVATLKGAAWLWYPASVSDPSQLVTAQYPPAGANVAAGATINLTVGNTPPPNPPTISVSANPTSGNAPLSVSFTATVTNTDSVSWDFGDGTTGTGTGPSHTYQSAGTFTVVATATGQGGTASASVTITVSNPPPPQVAVPDVSHMTPSDALAALQAVGLVGKQVVSWQSPVAGTVVDPGSTVEIS